MKGIILAGGRGTRLYPLTLGVSKQLLPIYNKPLIYYPLSILMLAGIRDILIITTPKNLSSFQDLLRDGSHWGLSFEYAVQNEPRGIADAFILGQDFINHEPVCLILGDNIFYGEGLWKLMQESAKLSKGAMIFGYRVHDPSRHGIVEFDEKGKIISLEEKPEVPRSLYAVPGLYFYDAQVVDIASNLKPSQRGELEITDLNRVYLEQDQLRLEVFGRGIAWLDAGTHATLLQAGNFIQAVEERQGVMISCPEEIAYRMKFINSEQLHHLARAMDHNRYGEYLLRLLEETSG